MLIVIDKLSRTPIYEQVVEQVEMHIRLGDLPRGEPLPSVRSLSQTLNVNPNTLQKAYSELERRGLCVSVPGSGRFVTADAADRLLSQSREDLNELKSLVARLHEAGLSREEILSSVEEALSASKHTKGETL